MSPGRPGRQRAAKTASHDSPTWKGEPGALPTANRLLPLLKEQVAAGLWPQFEIGAHPFSFQITPPRRGSRPPAASPACAHRECTQALRPGRAPRRRGSATQTIWLSVAQAMPCQPDAPDRRAHLLDQVDPATGRNAGCSPRPHGCRIVASLAKDCGSSCLRSCAGAPTVMLISPLGGGKLTHR